MKKLLIMIGLIGSVYGSEISISDWSSLIGYCTDATNITETICGNSVTFDNVYTLKTDNTSYTFNVGADVNMPASTKLVIPTGITLNLTTDNHSSYYMKNNSAIEVNGTLNKACHNFYGPNEEGTENSYTNAYIIVNGELNQNEGNCIGTNKQYSILNFSGSGTINNSKGIRNNGYNSSILFSGTENISNTGDIYTSWNNSSITFSNTGEITNTGSICTWTSNSSITFSGTGNISNTGSICTWTSNSSITFSGTREITNTGGISAQGRDSSITFSNTGEITNTGKIYFWSNNTSITISKDTTIRNKGGSIYMPVDLTANTSLILDGTLIFEKGEGEDGKYPGFNTESTEGIYTVISGSGTIDMSSFRDADMTVENTWSISTTQGCINIPKETFSSSTPFTGAIKLPYKTKCKMLDLTNASDATILVPVLKEKGIILEGNKITKGITITKLPAEEFSKLNITLPNEYDSYDAYDINQSTSDTPVIPLTLANILVSEYNTAGNYIITDELDETIYETNEEVTVNFGIKGRTPLDLRGHGKITFKGDNSEYRIPRPMIKFDGEKSVFPRDAIYDHVEFADGCVIPENTIIVAKNPQNISNITVNGHLILE